MKKEKWSRKYLMRGTESLFMVVKNTSTGIKDILVPLKTLQNIKCCFCKKIIIKSIYAESKLTVINSRERERDSLKIHESNYNMQ